MVSCAGAACLILSLIVCAGVAYLTLTVVCAGVACLTLTVVCAGVAYLCLIVEVLPGLQ